MDAIGKEGTGWRSLIDQLRHRGGINAYLRNGTRAHQLLLLSACFIIGRVNGTELRTQLEFNFLHNSAYICLAFRRSYGSNGSFPHGAIGSRIHGDRGMATLNPPLKLVTSLPRPGDSLHLRVPSWSDIERDRSPVNPNLAPDYVVVFQPSQSPSDASRLEALLRALTNVRLEMECRPGGEGKVLVFVRCPERVLKSKVRKSRSAQFDYSISDT
jgi:hypothetical protein